jgi:hypothetical protein
MEQSGTIDCVGVSGCYPEDCAAVCNRSSRPARLQYFTLQQIVNLC